MEIKTRRETRQTLAQWFEEKGFQKGYKEGLQKVRLALCLLSKGMSREDVAEMANLPLAEIDKMIN
ncbi:transposase [Escherichia coli]|uniref:transposase n=1 Tax=Escherichia coli TaxID=562 RepID=UPI001F03EA37|nr:transposase [Escherichia coli]